MLKLNPEYRHEFESSEDLKRYMYGGKGILTLESPSGKSHTYMISRPRDRDSFPDDVRFIYALHEHKQFYVGMLEQGVFRITRNSRFLLDNEISKGASYLNKLITIPGLFENTHMIVYHEGICCRCGRPLITDLSISRGIGPKCFKYMEDDYIEYDG